MKLLVQSNIAKFGEETIPSFKFWILTFKIPILNDQIKFGISHLIFCLSP